MRATVHDCFGPPPTTLAPSALVRRWDEALILGLFAFGVAYVFAAWLLLRPLPLFGEVPSVSFGELLLTGLRPLSLAGTDPELWSRALLDLAVGCATGVGGFVVGLRPHCGLRHVSGPRLLTGKDAERNAATAAANDRGGKPGFLNLHPALELAKGRWTRHTVVLGSVGAGKTQILMSLLVQVFALPRDRRPKLFCVDVKGDFTAKFKAPLISPWDARSLVWDIGRDLASPSAAATFAQALVPVESGNPFWAQAAQAVLIGAITSIRSEHGTDWGWADLARRVNLGRELMAEILAEHAPKAAVLMGSEESNTSMGVLATLAAHTKVIDDLAAAWGDAAGRKKLSLCEWASDDYRGRGQVIVQAGPDAALTRAYLGAMVKLLEQTIINPALPDSSERTLLFVLDELPSLKVNVSALIDKGRSKGVVVLAGLQSLAQLRGAMGQHEAQALVGMVGTHVIGRVQMSEDRDQVAALFGRERVCVANGAAAHEETRAVVEPSVLSTELGVFQVSRKLSDQGSVVRALVAGVGPDVLMLDWPVIAPKDVRPSFVPAVWSTPGRVEALEAIDTASIKAALAKAAGVWEQASVASEGEAAW